MIHTLEASSLAHDRLVLHFRKILGACRVIEEALGLRILQPLACLCLNFAATARTPPASVQTVFTTLALAGWRTDDNPGGASHVPGLNTDSMHDATRLGNCSAHIAKTKNLRGSTAERRHMPKKGQLQPGMQLCHAFESLSQNCVTDMRRRGPGEFLGIS